MNPEASDINLIPSELTLPTPRRVQLNLDGDGRYLVMIVVLFFAGGLVFLGWLGYYDLKQFERRAALRGNVSKVVGEVTGFNLARYSPTSVNYKFIVNEISYSGNAQESTTPGPSTRFEEGENILIRYLPSDPDVNHPDSWEWSITSAWLSHLLWIFLTSVGCFVFVFLLRERKFVRVGRAVLATVSACTPKGRFFLLEYEFRVRGEVVTGTNNGPEEYAPGARVWIVYLSQKPENNRLYPSSFYTIA